ncbi:hypothetical protein HDU80_011021 [Chytriomyces hyalinus]|nr:hypothetical protein HDU80_011021 [Chytriomyces hyalinus]
MSLNMANDFDAKPAWEPIRVALLGPDEEEADRKLDVIASFIKTREQDFSQKFSTKEDIMWTALQTTDCLSLLLVLQKIDCVDFAGDDLAILTLNCKLFSASGLP